MATITVFQSTKHGPISDFDVHVWGRSAPIIDTTEWILQRRLHADRALTLQHWKRRDKFEQAMSLNRPHNWIMPPILVNRPEAFRLVVC